MGLRTRGVALAALLVAALAGCGGKGITPVRGVVTLEGQPVAGATVLFMPEDENEGHPATGFTSSDGTFQLMTYKANDGALPGTYHVLIRKTEAAQDQYAAERTAKERAKGKFEDKVAHKNQKAELPEAYARFDKTPLRCTVPATGAVTFDLHKDGRP
jgi:hypothetical protein